MKPERGRPTKQTPTPATDDDTFTYLNKYKNLSSKNKKNKESCNCWICKIVDSSTTTQPEYEKYNIVDEDSIYSPPFEELRGGKIFVSMDTIDDLVEFEVQKRLGGGFF